MDIAIPKEVNLILGPPEKWDTKKLGECGSLPTVRTQDKEGNVCYTSAWKPTTDEMMALMRGDAVYVSVFSGLHPPLMLSTGPIKGTLD